MKNIALEFKESGKSIAESLSALVQIGDSIFAGGDEGVHLARLEAGDDGFTYVQKDLINLSRWFDLPLPPTADEVKEIDIEGLDLDREGNVLWMIGSHSLKRGKAERGKKAEKNLKALSKVTSDANRFFLGCVRLQGADDKPRLAEDGARPGDMRAAQLVGDAHSSRLLDEIRRDPLFERFCRADADSPGKDYGIPGKDNGVDIEGLACAPGGRLLVGMRGPVLRGIATILEIEPGPVMPTTTQADRLELEAIGPQGRRYRRHFLDLGGNGIRDLCWDGDDLLVLAGPTAGLDSPPLIYRWKAAKNALGKPAEEAEQFQWRIDETSAEGTLAEVSLGFAWTQSAPGIDHAESITRVGSNRLAIGYDSPGKPRFKDTATVMLDVVKL